MQGPEPEGQSPGLALPLATCVTQRWPPRAEVQEESVGKWRMARMISQLPCTLLTYCRKFIKMHIINY